MSEYSDRVAAREAAWKKFSDYLDSIWQGKQKLDEKAFMQLRDEYTATVNKVDELWRNKPRDAFKE